MSRKEDELRRLVRTIFGESYCGLFGIGMQSSIPKKRQRKIAKKSRRAHETDDEKDSSAEYGKVGIIKDILLEATALTSGGSLVSRVYLTSGEGFSDLDCSWVRSSGMSKAASDWWLLERELRYPDPNDRIFSRFDSKTRTLSLSPSTSFFSH